MASEKRIRLQDEKGTLSILAINRGHPEYTAFRTALLPTERDLQRAEEADAKEAGLASRPRAVEAFRFGSSIRCFLPEEADCEETLTHTEAREILKQYMDDEGLNGEQGQVVLDARLCDALYARSKKELAAGVVQESFLTHDSKKNLYSRWDARLDLYHRTESGGAGQGKRTASAWRKGPPPAVQVDQIKVKGHSITRVIGVETYGIDAEELAIEAKKAFACTTTAEALPGKSSTGMQVELQGHIGDQLLEHLHKAHGVPRKYIKVKKPKGKK